MTQKTDISAVNPSSALPGRIDALTVNGARVNNLKNIDVTIPHNSLTVITGLSGRQIVVGI